MQRKDNIEQHLLDYSADQEVPYLPVFVQGRFYKRISREEIKGWSSGHPVDLFHKEKSPKRIKDNLKLKTIDLVAKKNNIAKPLLTSDTSRQWPSAREPLQNKHSQVGSLFKTFQERHDISSKTLQKTQRHQQQQKLDFIKGRKMACPKVRNTLIVKPFFTTFSIRNNSCKSQNMNRLQQKPSSRKIQIKSLSKQKVHGLQMISYPIDGIVPFERDADSQQLRLASFMRKFRR